MIVDLLINGFVSNNVVGYRVIVLSHLGLDKGDLILGQPVALV